MRDKQGLDRFALKMRLQEIRGIVFVYCRRNQLSDTDQV